MLDLPRYLLGVAELAVIGGFAMLGASSLRSRLLPSFAGPLAILATGVLALALVVWVAEFLGTLGWFDAAPYLMGVVVVGAGLRLGVGGGWGCPSRAAASSFSPHKLPRSAEDSTGEKPSKREGHPHPPPDDHNGRAGERRAILIALAIAAVAVVHFAAGVRLRLSTGMTGFDSTWYHGPFAAGFFQSGDTWSLHFIAPQFLAWFYPANGEIFHAVGMLAFGRDILSPLLNLGWFVGCLLALWCIGRPYRVAPWSLALGAVALSVPALSDQAGEARNDIVGIFFLLAAVAVAVNARPWGGSPQGDPSVRSSARIPMGSANALVVAGLAAGLAAGTKLNFLLPAAALVLGLALIAPAGRRWRALAATGLAALAGGGYWYLRNLIHSGNPLPWFDHLGSISLPAPEQALGGREGHSVLGYLTDGSVWSDWLLPGLHHGLTIFWPLLAALALSALLLCLLPLRCSFSPRYREKEQRGIGGPDASLRVAGFAGFAVVLAWLIAPTSASGPDGMPRGFESGLRYLAPALVLGLALLPAALSLMPVGLPTRLRGARLGHPPNGRILKMPASLGRHLSGRGVPKAGAAALVLAAAIAIGYPIQRHYLQNRYASPTFAAPGLNAAFKWANQISGARIATTSTRQYPLYGRDLSNRVQYVGIETAHGGFVPPSTCPQWRRLLNTGNYDYVVATRDRIEPGKPPYPPTARWTEGPGTTVVLRKPPTAVLKLNAPLDPSACP
jgi:hypothetical protein